MLPFDLWWGHYYIITDSLRSNLCQKTTLSNHILDSSSTYSEIFVLIIFSVKETTADASLLECTFPQWATDIGTLHSFALTSQYTFSEDGTTMKMSNYSHLSGEGVPQSISVCQKIVEELYSSTAMVRMVVKVTAQW